MDQKHYNELVMLSREIYNGAADRLTNYCTNKYCGNNNDTTEHQLEDYLFVAEKQVHTCLETHWRFWRQISRNICYL